MSNLPYDVEIEYLESTGTQWIDSGVQSQNNLVYDFKLYETNDNNQRRFFGFKESSDWLSNGMNDANWGSSFFYVDFANTETNITALNSKDRRNNNGIYHFDFTDGNAKLIHNNTQVWTSNKTGTYDGSQTVYVFSLNYNGSSSAPGIGRIYYFQIRKNGVLLRDYIPVRVGNVGYLYDKVSGELFGNAGTGDFILGEDKVLPNPFGFRRRLMMAQRSGEPHLPAGYTRLEYIKSEGGYIDTGRTLQLGDIIELDIWAKSRIINTVLYGYRWNGNPQDSYQIISGIQYEGTYTTETYIYVSTRDQHNSYLPTDSRHTVTIETGNENNIYVDGNLIDTTSGTSGFDNNGISVFNPCIFTFNSIGTPNTNTIADGSRCYGYKVVRNRSEYVWLVPAQRDYDQVNGLYDVVNREFLSSPNGVAFSSNLDEITPLYPIVAWYGNKGTYRYSTSADGHFCCRLGSGGSSFIWVQDVSLNPNGTPDSTNNYDGHPVIFSIRQGDALNFKIKNITRNGGTYFALNIRNDSGGQIGVSSGSITGTNNVNIVATASQDQNVTGVYFFWENASNRAVCLDIEFWVNNIRYI